MEKTANYYIRKIYILPIIIIYSMFLFSCGKSGSEPIPTEGNVQINFDWKNLSPNDPPPTTMQLSFFSGNTVLVKECNGTSFSGTLPVGNYKVMVYNKGGSHFDFKNQDSYDNMQAYAITTKADVPISQPSYLYAIGIPSLTVNASETTSSKALPAALIHTAVIEFNIEGNIEAISSIGCSLSGIAPAIKLANAELVGSTGLIDFKPTRVATENKYAGTITFFGAPKGASNTLSIDIGLSDGGNKKTEPIDLSEALQNAEGINIKADVNIKIEETPMGISCSIVDWTIIDAGDISF